MRPAAEYFADQPRIVEHDRWLVEQPHDGYAAAAFAVLAMTSHGRSSLKRKSSRLPTGKIGFGPGRPARRSAQRFVQRAWGTPSFTPFFRGAQSLKAGSVIRLRGEFMSGERVHRSGTLTAC